MNASSGVMPFNSNKTSHSEGRDQGTEKGQAPKKAVEMTFLNSVASELSRVMHLDDNLEEKPIDIQVTSDGLRVTLFDRAKRPLFKNESTEFTEWGQFVMQNLAWMIDRHHFSVTIDGHTRAPSANGVSDDRGWDLSSSRANASRRMLVYYAVSPDLIERVTGYASTRPLPNESPTAESNQRVTLSLSLEKKARVTETPATADQPNAAPANSSATSTPAAPAESPAPAKHSS